VADAPVDALLAHADELARRWAIELMLARPLASLAEVPLEDLAREAPGLCAQLARALASDAELERLVTYEEPGGREGAVATDRLAALVRAGDASACAEQAEALRGVLWEATLSELRDPPVRLVADLSDRIAFVCAAALAAALELSPIAAVNVSDAPHAPPAAGREQVLYSSSHALGGRRGAVLIDERDQEPPHSAPGGGRSRGTEGSAPPDADRLDSSRKPTTKRADVQPGPESPLTGRPLPWDTPLRVGRPEGDPPPAGGAHAARSERRSASAPDSDDPVMRITRRSVSPIDERP
jgi:hypothetical protein